MNRYFKEFQRLCIDILAQSDNCQESQDQFRAARSVPELVTAWQHFWAGILHEVPQQVVTAFASLYPIYRDDIIRAGVFYNEAPPDGYPNAMILVGNAPVTAADSTAPIIIGSHHRVYVLGDHPLMATDNANVHIVAPNAVVTLTGNARCNIEVGTVTARERSTVFGRGNVICYDSTTIAIYGGYLTDHGHLAIQAYNDAVIHSFTTRRITLYDQAQLHIDI